ncbi:MAG: nucleotide-binding protein [Chloroflexi bacterium]|nr:nucleotide-binding protein [Chloroflexota bacterium]
MTPKRITSSQQTPSHPPNLTMPRLEADKQLASRIDLGKALLSYTMNSMEDYEGVNHKHKLWHEYNTELLRRIFDSDELSKEYCWDATPYTESLSDKIKYLSKDINTHIASLESIKERLPLYPESPGLSGVTSPVPAERAAPTTKAVFLVHGTDHGVKETVARYLTKLNLDPIVLHEQPNLGDTIIEKLERTSPVAFSVVLLTCDDKACPISDTSSLKPRARQNVVFELGYFIGKLGRGKVCALYAEGVELPSDFHGVVYIPFDTPGAWRLSLARELKASGLDIDLNNAF